jgi:hypothetical protein
VPSVSRFGSATVRSSANRIFLRTPASLPTQLPHRADAAVTVAVAVADVADAAVVVTASVASAAKGTFPQHDEAVRSDPGGFLQIIACPLGGKGSLRCSIIT